MKDLIEALQIFAKYSDLKWPTHCEHDLFSVIGIAQDQPTTEDIKRLEELSFSWMEDEECWGSFRFGSA